jgi:CRP-like cAMP-binding protein
VPEGEVLFEMESIGYEFFIILKGKVGIMVKLPMSVSESNAVLDSPDVPFIEKTRTRTKSNFHGVPKSPININSTVLRKTSGYQVLHRSTLLKEIKELADGGSFGEAALTKGKSALRNATILCKEDCYLAVLDKENYERIIGEHQQKALNEKRAFMKKVSIFKFMQEQDLGTLLYFFDLKSLVYRSKIFAQGDDVQHVVVIKSGRVRVGDSSLTPAGSQREFAVSERRVEIGLDRRPDQAGRRPTAASCRRP